ncbi:MAG: DUF4178 domain-containing protein [Fluviicoccus sp.]|uniref:DUF4178 domain-containing protein n=1 Tax=Fluviicoccus sp. TaxID=2003552 RepID=UPI002726244E|nr:DUF4178 domain-containing protein [Fluviicoccus sp.]MDO8330923.1 DUF4178 domain-containing protein [Fluviicoccus sp.]
MFTAPCPGCGAPLNFRSPASVMAVCGYCQTTALRDAESVRDQGKISQVLDDLSPLQTGVTGQYEGRAFTLLGRLQMAYDSGRWSEWFAWFDDGTEGWLSEASGQYVFTLRQPPVTNAPPFEGLKPGKLFYWQDQPFRASDVRTAQCTGGQGELPFAVGKGWEAKTADFRVGAHFLTLDYSEGTPPVCYAGRAVTLDELNCQLLRDEEQIARNTGQEKGKIQALDCPNCGSPIQAVTGMTAHLVCPSCHADVDLNGDKATVLAIHEAVSAQSTLRLGEIGNFDGAAWTVIGFLKARESGEEDSVWTEYLLFNLKKGFSWLVESDEGWETVAVLNEIPDILDDSRIRYQGQTLKREWTYGSEVTYAAGAFNWRIRVGDRSEISDFKAANFKLTRESYQDEITWSLARREPAATVLGWFGREVPVAPRYNPVLKAPGELGSLFKIFSTLLWVINLPLIVFGNGNLVVTLIAWGVLWIFNRTGD